MLYAGQALKLDEQMVSNAEVTAPEVPLVSTEEVALMSALRHPLMVGLVFNWVESQVLQVAVAPVGRPEGVLVAAEELELWANTADARLIATIAAFIVGE
jgi:hypothetical protein